MNSNLSHTVRNVRYTVVHEIFHIKNSSPELVIRQVLKKSISNLISVSSDVIPK